MKTECLTFISRLLMRISSPLCATQGASTHIQSTVTVKAELCVLQGKVRRDAAPFFVRERDFPMFSCVALGLGREGRAEHTIT